VKTADGGTGAAVCKPDDFKLSQNGAKAIHFVRGKTVTSADDVAINNGQWRLMTGTYDADTRTVKLYVDGVFVQQTKKTNAISNYGTSLLMFGASTIEGASPFTGYLDEVRIWNYPRTAEDIVGDYYNVTGVAPCYQPNFPGSVFDVAGAVDGSGDPIGDCKVDIQDFAEFANSWLANGIYQP
jgi:hypothetical protein